MLYSQSEVGDNRFELGKGCDGCDLGLCGYTSRCGPNTKEQDIAAYVKAYPSPPMSGSLPPTSAGAPAVSDPSRNRDANPSLPQDAPRGIAHQQLRAESSRNPPTMGSGSQAYQPGTPAHGSYGFQRPEAPPNRPLSYPQILGPGIQQQQYLNPSPA